MSQLENFLQKDLEWLKNSPFWEEMELSSVDGSKSEMTLKIKDERFGGPCHAKITFGKDNEQKRFWISTEWFLNEKRLTDITTYFDGDLKKISKKIAIDSFLSFSEESFEDRRLDAVQIKIDNQIISCYEFYTYHQDDYPEIVFISYSRLIDFPLFDTDTYYKLRDL